MGMEAGHLLVEGGRDESHLSRPLTEARADAVAALDEEHAAVGQAEDPGEHQRAADARRARADYEHVHRRILSREAAASYSRIDHGTVGMAVVVAAASAAIAGLVPGDVITRMDQVGVRSVEDLRYGVSVSGDTLPLTLIREGESRQILLRKR